MEHTPKKEQPAGYSRIKVKGEDSILSLIVLSVPAYVLSLIYLHNPTSGLGALLDYGLAILYEITGEILVYNLPYHVYIFALKFDLLLLGLLAILNFGHFLRYAPDIGILAIGVYTLKDIYELPAANGQFYVLLLLLMLACARYAIIPAISGRIELKPRYAVLVITMLAFFLRAWNLTGYVGLENTFVEGQLVYSAEEIASGLSPYKDFVYTHSPLYSYIIAAVFKLFGSGLMQARALNMVLSTMTVIPIYLVAKKIAGANTAILTAFLWAIHPTAIESGRLVVRETAMIFFVLSCISIIFYRKTSTWFFPAGLILGLAILSKEVAALTILPVLFAYNISKKEALLFLSGIAVGLLPMAYFYVAAKENVLFALQFHSNTLPLETHERIDRIYQTIFNSSPLLIIIAAVGIAKIVRMSEKYADFLLAWSIYSSILLTHKTYIWHYAVQLLPFFLIFLSVGIIGLVNYNRKSGKRNYYAYLGLFLLLMVTMIGVSQQINKKNEDVLRVAAELSKNSAGGSIVSPEMLVPFFAKRSVPGDLHEFGYQNRLMTGEKAITLLEKHNVSAVVMDKRIKDQQYGDILKEFRDYVKRNYKKTSEIPTEYGNVSIWTR